MAAESMRYKIIIVIDLGTTYYQFLLISGNGIGSSQMHRVIQNKEGRLNFILYLTLNNLLT
jgi:hypothetical protein